MRLRRRIFANPRTLRRLEQLIEVGLVLHEEAVEGVSHQLLKSLFADQILAQAQVIATHLVGQHIIDAVGDLFLIGTLDALVKLIHALLANAIGGADALENEGHQDGLVAHHQSRLLAALKSGASWFRIPQVIPLPPHRGTYWLDSLPGGLLDTLPAHPDVSVSANGRMRKIVAPCEIYSAPSGPC